MWLFLSIYYFLFKYLIKYYEMTKLSTLLLWMEKLEEGVKFRTFLQIPLKSRVKLPQG